MSYTANITVSTTFMCRRVSLTVDNTEAPREGLLQAKGFQSHSLLVGPRGDPLPLFWSFSTAHLMSPPLRFRHGLQEHSKGNRSCWPSQRQPS